MAYLKFHVPNLNDIVVCNVNKHSAESLPNMNFRIWIRALICGDELKTHEFVLIKVLKFTLISYLGLDTHDPIVLTEIAAK